MNRTEEHDVRSRRASREGLAGGQDHANEDSVVREYNKWKRRNRYYYESLDRLYRLNIPSGARVLEVGCGDGDTLAAVAPSRGVGVDVQKELVDYATRRHPQLHFVAQEVHTLELDEQFDYIILSGVLGEVSDIQTVLQRLRSVCHRKTKLLITQYNYLWEPILRVGQRLGLRRPLPLQNWLSLPDLSNLLEVCDYRVIRSQRRLLLPKYVPLISHLCNRFLAWLPLVNRLCMVTFLVGMPNAEPGDPDQTSCSVIIPTKDEKGNIAAAIARTPRMGSRMEYIFVDGASTDGTIEEIQRMIQEHPELDITLLQQDGRGKGDAVRKGFGHATGDVLMILDSDLTVPPEDLPKYFDTLVRGRGEFVNGSRLVYQLGDESMRFLNLLANKIFAILFSWLLEQRLKDTLCGTKVLFRSDYERIAANRSYFGDFDPFGDFDLLFGAAKLNLKIVEIPIRYQRRTYGDIKIERFKHGWLLLKMCGVAFRKLKL